MAKLLDAFASFCGDWFLEEGFWGELLVQIPRKETREEDWILGVFQGPDQSFGLLIGPGFLSLDDFAKKTWTKLCLYHLCLGHPLQVSSISIDPAGHLAAILGAINLLNEKEKEIFPKWSSLLAQLECTQQSSLVSLKKQVIQEKLLNRVEEGLLSKIFVWHQYWHRSHAKSLKHELEHFSRQALRLAGSYGEHTLSKVLRADIFPVEAGKLPWQQILRSEVGKSKKRRILATQKRPSKRYGVTPGMKLRNHMHVAVVMDTSASMHPDQLAQFRNEIKGIHQAGAKITILEADVIVQRTYPFQGFFKDFNSYGRGGTAFDNAIQQAEHNLKADLIIYFSDGEGPVPTSWQGTPLLWCLCGTEGGHLPGKKLYL